MKNFTNFESNVSGLTRVCLGFVSGLSRFSLGEVAEKCSRYAAMIFCVLAMSMANIGMAWGTETISFTHGFEDDSAWGGSNTSNRANNATAKRTGSKGAYATGSSGSGRLIKGGSVDYDKSNTYTAMCWMKLSVAGKAGIGIGEAGGNDFNLSADTWTLVYKQFTAASNQTGKNIQPTCSIAANCTIYVDDVVFYKGTYDNVKPTSASSPNATTSSISWSNGSDANTGIQNTLIWRRTGGSSDDLTLNNQGVYAASATDQTGHWTCVSASVSSAATSYDGTFSADDRYAIVHRDLAYNYSTPTYVTITSAGTTWYVKGSFDSWGDGFNFTGAGTELTATVNITTAGLYEFKINNSDGDAWYGNGGNIGCNVSGWTFSTDESANCKFFASETGNYTFTFNTSTKALSVTYPTAQGKYYYKNTSSWGTVAVYRYVGGINNGWPGTQVVETETICGDTYYFTYADPGTTLIFNNNDNGSQTGNETASGNAGKYVQGTDGNDGWRTFPTYTISYDAGSGSGTMSSQSSIACGTDKATSSNTFTAPSGYQFAGWVANVDVTVGGSTKTAGTVLADGVTIQNVSSNITLTAQWELIPTYDVTYDANSGGTGTTASQTGNLNGAQVTTRANGFTPNSGKKFKWWNTASGGGGEDFYPGEKVTIDGADVALYAQWETVASNQEFWTPIGVASASTGSAISITEGDMSISSGGVTDAADINVDLTANATKVSKYSSTAKHAKVLAIKGDDKYIQVSFTDGSPINKLWLGTTTNSTDKKNLVVLYSTTADFSTGEYEKVTVKVNGYEQTSKAVFDFSPSTTDKYLYARIYRKISTAVYSQTGGDGATARIYSIKAQKGANCSTPAAPTGFSAGSISATGATFTITDETNVNNYDIYYSTSSSTPDGSTPATTTSTSKSKAITGLSFNTTYYAWVRSVCDASHKSAWVALSGSTFTTSNTAPTSAEVTPTNGWIYVPGEEIELTASADDTDAATTYTWYKGSDLATAKAAGAIQAAKTAAAGGTTLSIASCTASDAARYWCEISNGTGYETSASYDIKIYTFFLYDNTSSALGSYTFDAIDRDDKKISVSFNLDNTNYTYYFKLSNGLNVWFGTPSGNDDACITGSTPYLNALQEGAGNNIGLKSSFADEYTVEFYYNSNNIVVTYPVHNQAANKVVYFDNTLTEMDNMYIRIGHDANSSASSAFALVPGTANLYRVKTIAWSDFHAWSIADNTGWTGSNTIYQPWYDSEAGKNKPDDEYAITKQTDYQRYVIDDTISIIPTDEDNEEYGCQYYTVDKVTGMKTQTVTISDYSNGTITVNYVDTSNTARSFTSGSKTLAHTCVLTVTATPAEGYSLTSLTINETAHTSGNTHTLSAAATIAATFTANTTTITINANTSHHGSTTPGTVTATFGSALPSFTAAAGESGWNLTGYFTAETSGTKVINANGTLVASTDYADGSGNWKYETASLTLYAQYEEEGCTPQSISKVVVTGSSAGTTSGYNEKEYVGTPVISVNGKAADTTNIAGVSGKVTGYKMSSDGNSIVFATLSKGTFQEGDTIKIGITRRNDTRVISSNKNVLTIYYGTNKGDADSLTTISTGSTTTSGASEHEGAGFYKYTLTAADVTKIGSKKGIGLFRASSNGENPYVYSVEIIGCRDWTTCTAPTAVSAGTITSNGATFTITDAENTDNYELYISESSTAPTADATPTATSSSKTKVVSSLSASTTYYYWVRSDCGGYKSDWVAGASTFTTSAAATTYSVTYDDNSATSGSVPTDDGSYGEGDVVTVKTNSGSLTKTGYTFVGWSTSATPSSGIFYPAGYKFTMGTGNVKLYAVWGTGSTCITLTDFETSTHDNSSSKPDSQGKYLYGYKGTKSADFALTITGTTTNTVGVNSGVELQLSQSTNFTIYADNTTTGGTPATFSGVTSISFKIKAHKNTKIPNIEVYVGSTKVRTVIGGDESKSDGHEYDTSDYTTISITGIASLSGIVKFVNMGSGSSDYKVYFDDIQICSGSGAASGFDVTFNMNGHGSEISKIENVPSGSKIGAPIPVPTAAGYEFGGWYREAGCSNEWNFGSNTITKDTTLFAKWTGCAPTISADPSGTIYTKDAAATALSVTAATNDGGTLEYQWYSNESNSNSDGTEIPGATSASYTPSTALIGTIYYYCVVTNDCGNATSEVAAITVNDSKSNPTASWTIATPTHGGKGFSFSVTAHKNDGSTAWDGTLTTAMLSASEDVVLSGVTVSDNTISGTYGVKASATSPVTFYLELPSTTTQAAATLSEDKEFTACSGTGVDGSTYEVPVTAKYSSSASGKPSYLCETTYGYISPELGTSSVSLKSQTYDDFEYWMNSGRTSVLICTKVDAVKKIQIYLSANGGAAKVTNVYTAASYSTALKDYTALDAKSDYTVTYTDESGNSSIAKGENGHVDIAFTTNLDSGTVVYVALKDAAKFYGAKLTTGAGSGATIDTELAWSNSQSDGATVEKGEDDAEFTITASRSGAAATASLGEIRYSSSDTKIATVNATTGEVTIADTISFGEDEYKTTTIKATLVSSGCYKSASITYTLQVNKSTCKEAAGTVAITNESDCSVELTVSGYEDDATIQWQKDGSDIPSATSTTYTATTSGTYTAVTTKDCARTSNSIVVAMSATATASKIVDSWYVKNGRRTPDIALVQTTGATSFTVKSGETTIWDEANTNTTGFGGCDFELKEDGIIYLHGTKSNGDAPSDLVAGNETITVTVSGCGGALSGLDIIIKKQAETLKPSVAFVVDGTTRAKGGTATSVSTAKTSERPLWTYLSSSFTLTGCNIYWSVDSKELREYYSQYDAIVVTDDPKTQTTGAGGVEYVKAFGTLVDVRPILTMEAYVGRYTDGGWHVYNATPTSPNPRQVEMKLECKTHEIFAGVNDASDNVRTVTVNGDDYWYITIVDTTQSPYKGTTMDYKDLPALQGFDPSSFSDMLGIGTIHDDALQAGVERQQEPAARMMILGIQNNAMGALTNEGKLIIKNAISYLLKTNMEEVDDCSNYFTGATNTDWNEPTNWSKNSVPDFATKVRIMAPVVISDGQKVRASQVDIVVDGTSSQKDGKPEGTVTINPGGALVVGGTVNRAIAPHYGIDDLEPTTSEDLIVQANADKSAALILDNSSGLTGATVQMYSSSFWELVGSVKKKYWSYVAVPIQEALIPDYFYGAFTYYYEEKSGWEKKWDGDYLYPFQGIGLSRDAAGIENFWGPLVSTENRDIKLTKTAIGGGENLIANSWTAPIQIANFDADDFGDALATIYIYNTGKKDSYAGSTVIDANTSNQGAFTAGQWLGIPIGVAKLPEYTGLKVIPAMQTFEVDIPGEAPNGTETTLHLDYDRLVRGVNLSTDNLTEKLHAPKRSMNKNDGDVEAVMKVRVAGVHTLAEVWLIQDGAFGEGFDNGWEAYYAACDDRSPQLYAHSENGNMGIIAKQELEGTILGFAPSRDGADYTFSFYYRGDEELYLNDLLTETSTPITNEDTYSFTSSNNGNSNRFIISRNPYQSPLITTGTEEIGVEGQNSAKKIIYNDKIYILYNGVIYDAMGKVINRK